MIFGFPWRLAALAIVAAAILGVVGLSRYQVSVARAEAAEARESAAAMRSRLDAQNAEIERWRQAAEERAKRAAEARKQARTYRKKSDDAAARLRSFSAAGMGECDALRALVDLDRGR